MNILIGADVVPTKSNIDQFKSGNVLNLVDERLSCILHDADYKIFNLETPLVETKDPILKCGPNLSAPVSTIYGYKALGTSLLTLANNHIMDQDEQGLSQTIAALENEKIDYIGVGNNISEACRGKIVVIDGKKIGIYACTEHEFSIATDNMAGANPFDPLNSYDHIENLKQHCEFVIVLYHGGKEHYRYPSPYLKRVCEKFVDKGANVVLCQHSHCIGCEEKYKNGTIVYGQGNFLFDASENVLWQTGLLVQITDGFKVNYIPVQKDGNKVKYADNADDIFSQFYKRSEQIIEAEFIEANYKQFSLSNIDNYLSILSGAKYGLVFRILNKISGHKLKSYLLSRKYNSQRRTIIQNCIECEAHRELIIEGLKKYDS